LVLRKIEQTRDGYSLEHQLCAVIDAAKNGAADVISVVTHADVSRFSLLKCTLYAVFNAAVCDISLALERTHQWDRSGPLFSLKSAVEENEIAYHRLRELMFNKDGKCKDEERRDLGGQLQNQGFCGQDETAQERDLYASLTICSTNWKLL
jgi:hypothetical protein